MKINLINSLNEKIVYAETPTAAQLQTAKYIIVYVKSFYDDWGVSVFCIPNRTTMIGVALNSKTDTGGISVKWDRDAGTITFEQNYGDPNIISEGVKGCLLFF